MACLKPRNRVSAVFFLATTLAVSVLVEAAQSQDWHICRDKKSVGFISVDDATKGVFYTSEQKPADGEGKCECSEPSSSGQPEQSKVDCTQWPVSTFGSGEGLYCTKEDTCPGDDTEDDQVTVCYRQEELGTLEDGQIVVTGTKTRTGKGCECSNDSSDAKLSCSTKPTFAKTVDYSALTCSPGTGGCGEVTVKALLCYDHQKVGELYPDDQAVPSASSDDTSTYGQDCQCGTSSTTGTLTCQQAPSWSYEAQQVTCVPPDGDCSSSEENDPQGDIVPATKICAAGVQVGIIDTNHNLIPLTYPKSEYWGKECYCTEALYNSSADFGWAVQCTIDSSYWLYSTNALVCIDLQSTCTSITYNPSTSPKYNLCDGQTQVGLINQDNQAVPTETSDDETTFANNCRCEVQTEGDGLLECEEEPQNWALGSGSVTCIDADSKCSGQSQVTSKDAYKLCDGTTEVGTLNRKSHEAQPKGETDESKFGTSCQCKEDTASDSRLLSCQKLPSWTITNTQVTCIGPDASCSAGDSTVVNKLCVAKVEVGTLVQNQEVIPTGVTEDSRYGKTCECSDAVESKLSCAEEPKWDYKLDDVVCIKSDGDCAAASSTADVVKKVCAAGVEVGTLDKNNVLTPDSAESNAGQDCACPTEGSTGMTCKTAPTQWAYKLEDLQCVDPTGNCGDSAQKVEDAKVCDAGKELGIMTGGTIKPGKDAGGGTEEGVGCSCTIGQADVTCNTLPTYITKTAGCVGSNEQCPVSTTGTTTKVKDATVCNAKTQIGVIAGGTLTPEKNVGSTENGVNCQCTIGRTDLVCETAPTYTQEAELVCIESNVKCDTNTAEFKKVCLSGKIQALLQTDATLVLNDAAKDTVGAGCACGTETPNSLLSCTTQPDFLKNAAQGTVTCVGPTETCPAA